MLVYGPSSLGVKSVNEDSLDTSSLSVSSDTSDAAIRSFIPALFQLLRSNENEVLTIVIHFNIALED